MTTRLGKFSFRHRWGVMIAWLVAIVAGATAIVPLFDGMGDANQLKGTETGDAADQIDAGLDRGVEYTVLIDVDATAASTAAEIGRAVADTAAVPGVQDVSDPIVAADGRGVAVTVTLEKSEHQFVPFTDSKERMSELAADVPGATVRFGGSELIGDQVNEAIQKDLHRAELLSLPITLVVLVFIFGGVIAAGLPVVAAVGTVVGAGGLLYGVSGLVELDSNAITVLAILGLGLSVDYGLLLVARYREELVTTADRAEALGRTWGTAGRTVMFSALTVATALTGLLAFPIARLQGLAAAGVVTALVAMMAALTFTAALIRLAGARIRPSKRQLARHQAVARSREGSDERAELESGFFARLARGTQRRPLLVTAASVAVLAVLAIPLLQVNIKDPQLEGLPRDIEAVQVADELEERFGQTTHAAVRVLARTDPATLDAYAAQWATRPVVDRVEPARQMTDDLASVVFAVRGDGQDAGARELVEELRANRPVGYESWVIGDAAKLIDLNSQVASGLPWAIGITAGAMVILLYLMTGSVVIPLKAIVMNLLSLVATFGVLTAVFQDGWLAGPLDTITTGGLSPFMIVVVFAFAFAFSMDYEVFILGRIKEYVDAGEDSDTAVRHGLQKSGRIVSSAALLMLIVFACFAAATMGQIEQIGLGLFVAVLIDATIVRCVMLPAAMTLLGRAAWWAPRPLQRRRERFGMQEALVE